MTIKELITEEVYNELLSIQKDRPKLTFQNVGYEYVDKSKFEEEDIKAFNRVTDILKKSILGFSEFNNFRFCVKGNLRVRFQYNYNADEEGKLPFTGVGYLNLIELKDGFTHK